MLALEETKLDNPVFYSLQETHRPFCIGYKNLLCYDSAYSPFGGLASRTDVEKEMEEYAKTISGFYIVGVKPMRHTGFALKKELVCLQMICRNKIKLETKETIVPLNGVHEQDLTALVNQVQPGYFSTLTCKLGAYYGIFNNNRLVAVTGERMKMNQFTEISAVVTHPTYTGRGYAKQLVTHAVNQVISEERVPYLHVAEINSAAINLYEKLGFIIRRKISFWQFEKENA